MVFALRKENDTDNPVLAVPYGYQITAGRLAYYDKIGNNVVLISLLGEGEMDGCERVFYNGELIPEFDAYGVRNWKFHPGTYTDKALGYDDPVQGRPTLIPNLDFTFSGIAYIELRVPEYFTPDGDAEPDKLKVIVRGRRVYDYIRVLGFVSAGSVIYDPPLGYTMIPDTNVARSDVKIFSSNNALVAADLLTSFSKLPDTRINWGSVVDFKERCGAEVGVIVWSGGNSVGGTPTYRNVENFTELGGGALHKTSVTDWDAFATTEQYLLNGDNEPFWEITAGEGTFQAGWTAQTITGANQILVGVQCNVNGILSKHIDGVNTAIGNWSPGNVFKFTIEGGQMKVYQNEVALDLGVVPAPVYPLYGGIAGFSLGAGIELSKFKPIGSSSGSGDRVINRFDADVVFPGAIDVVTALEVILLRAPGVHWQDVNGQIVFLPDPDRPVVHKLTYDPTQTVRRSNIVQNSFSAYRKPPEDKPNFLRLSFRNKDDDFYTKNYAYADRPALRDAADMLNDPGIIDIGVANQSLADRVAESQMRVLADLDLFVSVKGQAGAFHVAKGDVIELSHDVPGWRESDPPKFLVISETFDSSIDTADERSFELQIYNPAFYSDTDHGPIQGYVKTDLQNPYVSPPVVESIDLTESWRYYPDGTYVPLIEGIVTFAEHSYRQTGKVQIKRPGDADYVNANIPDLIPDPITRQASFAIETIKGINSIRVISKSLAGNYLQPITVHTSNSKDVVAAPPAPMPHTGGSISYDPISASIVGSWTPSDSIDIGRTDVYYVSGGSEIFRLSVGANQNYFNVPIPTVWNDDLIYKVYAVNRLGEPSVALTLPTISAPEITNLFAQRILAGTIADRNYNSIITGWDVSSIIVGGVRIPITKNEAERYHLEFVNNDNGRTLRTLIVGMGGNIPLVWTPYGGGDTPAHATATMKPDGTIEWPGSSYPQSAMWQSQEFSGNRVIEFTIDGRLPPTDFAITRSYNDIESFTADYGTNTLTSQNHDLLVGQMLTISSTGTVPAPLVNGNTYYVAETPTPHTFRLKNASNGATIVITNNGSGTMTWKPYAPNIRIDGYEALSGQAVIKPEGVELPIKVVAGDRIGLEIRDRIVRYHVNYKGEDSIPFWISIYPPLPATYQLYVTMGLIQKENHTAYSDGAQAMIKPLARSINLLNGGQNFFLYTREMQERDNDGVNAPASVKVKVSRISPITGVAGVVSEVDV